MRVFFLTMMISAHSHASIFSCMQFLLPKKKEKNERLRDTSGLKGAAEWSYRLDVVLYKLEVKRKELRLYPGHLTLEKMDHSIERAMNLVRMVNGSGEMLFYPKLLQQLARLDSVLYFRSGIASDLRKIEYFLNEVAETKEAIKEWGA